ncbi:DUF4331 family protein [Spirosoma sp. KNUC1025]|uniref:DUF4331 family protein n=1 Tax=Spirosoma sp. KNUC1025 TaxID=2894082 RepID=UPI003866B378
MPNLKPYQLATGKAGNPLAAGKPFIHNFLPTLGDMLRLNMAVPATPRNDPRFSSLGLVQAAVLGLTDATYGNTSLQFIPNMDGFPNGRRLEDDVTTIELQAVGGVVLAAIGLWYDDFVAGGSPVTPQLLKVLSFNAGVTKNDTTFKGSFPFVQDPWRGFIGNSYQGPTADKPLSVSVLSYDCVTGNITFGRVGGIRTGRLSFRQRALSMAIGVLPRPGRSRRNFVKTPTVAVFLPLRPVTSAIRLQLFLPTSISVRLAVSRVLRLKSPRLWQYVYWAIRPLIVTSRSKCGALWDSRSSFG